MIRIAIGFVLSFVIGAGWDDLLRRGYFHTSVLLKPSGGPRGAYRLGNDLGLQFDGPNRPP